MPRSNPTIPPCLFLRGLLSPSYPACAKPRSTARGNPPRAQPRSRKPAGPSWHRDRDSAHQGRRNQADPFLSLATKPAGRPSIQIARSEKVNFSRCPSELRTHAGTSESGLIGGFLGGVF